MRPCDVADAIPSVERPHPRFPFARYRPWLEQEALKVVRGDKNRARRMARRALDRLWEWDMTRFCEGDEAYLRRALMAAMGERVPRERVRRDPGSQPPKRRSDAERGRPSDHGAAGGGGAAARSSGGGSRAHRAGAVPELCGERDALVEAARSRT